MNNSKSLEHFCQSHASLKTKIALLSFYKANFSIWINKTLLILEYLQLLSQLILLPTARYDAPAYSDYPFRVIIYFFKLVNPGYLLVFDEGSDSYTFTVLIVVFCAFLLKIGIFGYILCASLYNLPKCSWLIYLWKWIFKLQTRILYFLFTSFWIRAMTESLDGEKPTSINETTLACISGVMIVVEFVFSYLIETQLCYVLPNKDFLSSKNSHLQVMTLIQKFMMQVLLMIFRSDSEANAWIISLLSLVISSMRIHHHYRTLPLYNIKALGLQGDMSWIMLALNIAFIGNNILRSADYHGAGINFMISAWILLALLAWRMSRQVMSRIILRMLCQGNEDGSAEILLHKIVATKQLKGSEYKPTGLTEKSKLNHLVSLHQNVNFEKIFGIKGDKGKIEGDSTKEDMNRIYLLYCENLARRFPRNTLVKLYLAKIYCKSSEHYAMTIKMASEIENTNKWSRHSVTASLILYEMEKVLLNSQEDGGEGKLDFVNFIKNKVLVDRLTLCE